MPRTRRKGKAQPLYVVTGRALARGWERFSGLTVGFWYDLTQARGGRYYRALALFCVLCVLIGAGASLAWRTAAVQSAVSRYRAVFLGTGGGTPGESPPLSPTGSATPPPPKPEPASGGGTDQPVSGGGPSEPGIPAPGGSEPGAPRPDLRKLTRPLAGAVAVDFGWQYSATLADWRFHPGVDLLAPEGTAVRAALAGKVAEVAETFEYGLTVKVDHGGGIWTVYGQLKSNAVKVGEAVAQGQQLGIVGSPAGIELSDAAHLHFELLDGKEALNPGDYWK